MFDSFSTLQPDPSTAPERSALSRRIRWAIILLSAGSLLASSVALSGCRGYRFGNGSIFRPDVRSVHVPIFENDTFRRGLGQRLTEAVVREIQTRTPYSIASSTNSDTILRGRIVSEQKHVLGENQFDEPRELQLNYLVEVTWTTMDGTPLMQRFVLKLNESEAFVPEGGQTMVSAQQELINHIARQVVNQMEAGW